MLPPWSWQPRNPTRSRPSHDTTQRENDAYHRDVALLAPSEPAWYAYVLVSAAGRTYVGTTTDVERRLRQHNGELRGGARTTRAGRPWAVARVVGPFPGRGDAVRMELALRRRRGRARLVENNGTAR